MNQVSIKECIYHEPFSIYEKLRRKYSHTSILESLGDLDVDTSRYTIIGVISKERIIVNDQSCIIEDLTTFVKKQVNFFDVIDEWIHPQSVSIDNTDTFQFQLGAIGYLGYEMKYYFEKLDRILEKDINIPDAYLVKYSLMNVTDRVLNKSYWILDNNIDNLLIDEIEAYLKQPIKENSTFKVLGDCTPDFTEEGYLNIIKKTREYIRNGDIFQANITCRFSGRYIGDPFELYKYLRTITPNPFFAYLDFEQQVLSTSPERFFKIYNNTISTYPIKGTVKCEVDGVDQKDVLLGSEKNLAENIMITDLLRNDIGRVCIQGSVHVDTLCGLKKFNNLYHLESIIKGELKKGVDFSDILQATFPGGSITGAPKIRSMDIIEELETTQRGPYTGTIGFFGDNGYIDTNIAIRTIYFDDEKLYFHAGGGITIGSEAEDEYQELILKADRIKSGVNEFNILKKFRDDIDRVDNTFMELLNRRFDLIREVGKIKREYNISIMQDERVKEMILNKTEMCNNYTNIPKDFVLKFFHEIIKESMNIEIKVEA